jgi:hypothetical protein
MSSYYGWRDIGTGGPRRTPEINAIIGNFTSNNDLVKTPDDIAKEYCSNCGCKLVYSTKIKKWICSEKGCNLTKEESDILLGKAASSQQQTTTTPATADTTAFEKQSKSLLYDLESGIGGGFIPMQRAGNTDVISRQEEGTGGGYTMTLPSRKKNKGGGYTTPSGEVIELDSEQQKSVDRGYTIIEAKTHLPEPTGGPTTNIMETVSPEELRRRKKEDNLYDKRYEGQPDGDPLDRNIHSSSGLKV